MRSTRINISGLLLPLATQSISNQSCSRISSVYLRATISLEAVVCRPDERLQGFAYTFRHEQYTSRARLVLAHKGVISQVAPLASRTLLPRWAPPLFAGGRLSANNACFETLRLPVGTSQGPPLSAGETTRGRPSIGSGALGLVR